ncbi:MAG: MFS transporter [Gammaproteobacteria bacterium]|nr:MFS transporter [Gammaproteobacteria bacterium]
MNNANTTIQPSERNKQNPLIDLLVSIVIPSVILMKFSGDDHLGSVNALILALALPLSLGLFELFKYRKFNFIALLGIISVVLTGGIGLLQLDTQWLAIKEAAVPGIIGLAILLSTYTPYPLIRTLLFNASILNIDKINQKLEDRGTSETFQCKLQTATYLLSGSFFFSSFMNYILARWLVTSPTGSTAFNEELGQMTLLSYPMIAIPSMLMMLAIFYYLWRSIHGMTGLSLEQVLVTNVKEKEEA